ncbi:hypothetical protein DFH08DRAFT_820491 [Mycena albidolilacea]|uniref:Uncharacterized protein n=1 Tax=Mycena albidolilacea TaxID=1033008 RepID=A0AAD6ZD92_9AGAR|nr:hypothetical protein DFH08DRAFT_820491 [Mycena albidolilacea]
MDRLTDSQNRFTEEGEQFEQAPGGLTKITTDTEDMPSTHTKPLSSLIYAVFFESSQMQSRKKADDIVGTSSSSSPKRNLERRGRARKIERKGDKEAQAYGTHASSGEGAGLLHTYHCPRGARTSTRHAPRTRAAAGCTPRHASTSRGRIRGTYAMCVSGDEWGRGGGEHTDGMRNAREWATGESLALEVLELGCWGRGSAWQGRIDSGRAGAGEGGRGLTEKWKTDIEMERRGKEDSAIARS